MAAPGGLFGAPAAGDNRLFVRLRWVLFLWILVDVSVHYEVEPWRFWSGIGLAAAFALTQVLLWRLPARFLRGLRLFTAIFLLDLFFTVATLFLAGQAEPRLLVVMFLTLFITALVQKVSLAVLVSAVVMAVYAALRLEGHDSFGWQDTRQLLDLPFLLITAVHASVIVSEARFHEEVLESLEVDNKHLSSKLGNTTRELKDRIRFVMGAFDAVPSAVLVLDPHGSLRAFNRLAEETFGVLRHKVLDHTLFSLPFLESLRQELRSREGSELFRGAWLHNAKMQPFYASVRNGIARDSDGALLNMAVFIMPAQPPAEAPTYEAWLALQTPVEDLVLQDGMAQPAHPAASDGDAPAPMPSTPKAHADKNAQAVTDQSETGSGLVQRVIAATVTTERKDQDHG